MNNYKCDKCDNVYKSYKSMWKHSKIKHPKIDDKDKKLKCNYCNELFSHASSKSRHEKKCKIKNSNDDITILKKEIEELKKEIENKNNSGINENNKINGDNNNLTNTINNNSNNTIIQLVSFGDEKLDGIFTKKEEREILRLKYNAIDRLTMKIHFDKFLQWHNIVITNLKDDLAYKYNKDTQSFITVTKNDLLEELIDGKLFSLEEFLDNNDEKLDDKFKARLKEIIDEIRGDTEIRKIKKKELKLLLYNNRDKVNIKK